MTNAPAAATNPAITEEQLSKVIVPMTALERQTRIAKLLDTQYVKAEILFSEAQKDIEKAKREIKFLILGNMEIV